MEDWGSQTIQRFERAFNLPLIIKAPEEAPSRSNFRPKQLFYRIAKIPGKASGEDYDIS